MKREEEEEEGRVVEWGVGPVRWGVKGETEGRKRRDWEGAKGC